MAFNRDYLSRIGGGSGINTGAPVHWAYKTADTLAACVAADYFLNAWKELSVGDKIEICVVTNLGASNEALADAGSARVNAVSSTAVDCTNITDEITTDTT